MDETELRIQSSGSKDYCEVAYWRAVVGGAPTGMIEKSTSELRPVSSDLYVSLLLIPSGASHLLLNSCALALPWTIKSTSVSTLTAPVTRRVFFIYATHFHPMTVVLKISRIYRAD